MYEKYGRIHKAWELFHKMHDENIVSWNTIIIGYAIHCYNKDSLKLLNLLKHLGYLCGDIMNNVEA